MRSGRRRREFDVHLESLHRRNRVFSFPPSLQTVAPSLPLLITIRKTTCSTPPDPITATKTVEQTKNLLFCCGLLATLPVHVCTHTHTLLLFSGPFCQTAPPPFSRQSESIFCSSTEAIRPLDSPSPPRFSPISLLPSNRRLFPLPPSLRHATNYPPFRDTNYNFGSKAQTEKRSVGRIERTGGAIPHSVYRAAKNSTVERKGFPTEKYCSAKDFRSSSWLGNHCRFCTA